MGIVIVAALFYIIFGTVAGLLISKIVKPSNMFKRSCALTIPMANFGDIPIAIMLSIANSAPFNEGDAEKGIAQIAKDVFESELDSGLPEVDAAKVIAKTLSDEEVGTVSKSSIGYSSQTVPVREDYEKKYTTQSLTIAKPENVVSKGKINNADASKTNLELVSVSEIQGEGNISNDPDILDVGKFFKKPTPLSGFKNYRKKNPSFSLYWDATVNPNVLTVVISLIIALTPIKDLFHPNFPKSLLTIHNEPPLLFLLDASSFISGLAVPMGLISLGAALGTLKVEKFLSAKILGSIAFTKLILFPLLGIGICQFFTFIVPVIDPNNKILRFLIMIQACVPTASSMVYFTQYWHSKGECTDIAGVILVQSFAALFTLTVIWGKPDANPVLMTLKIDDNVTLLKDFLVNLHNLSNKATKTLKMYRVNEKLFAFDKRLFNYKILDLKTKCEIGNLLIEGANLDITLLDEQYTKNKNTQEIFDANILKNQNFIHIIFVLDFNFLIELVQDNYNNENLMELTNENNFMFNMYSPTAHIADDKIHVTNNETISMKP
ncbi:Protein M3 [Clydaea vesicula]|uniref:Protein M3 n=1 Tax=Clydaea vesicula TaxID=447962 RepID=A0AAD5U6M5_9FUNG|nr:Protein M3 [Clydaea vesicula]